MAELFSLAERVREKLKSEASRGDPNLRRVLCHATLLDSLFEEIAFFKSALEDDVQDDVPDGLVAGHDDWYSNDSDDSSSDSDSDSDSSDSDSDSDASSDTDSDTGSDPEEWWLEDLKPERHGNLSYKETLSGDETEDKARDRARMEFWTTWEMAKSIAAGGPVQIGVHEIAEEIEV